MDERFEALLHVLQGDVTQVMLGNMKLQAQLDAARQSRRRAVAAYREYKRKHSGVCAYMLEYYQILPDGTYVGDLDIHTQWDMLERFMHKGCE